MASHCPLSSPPTASITINNAGRVEEAAHSDPPNAWRESVLHLREIRAQRGKAACPGLVQSSVGPLPFQARSLNRGVLQPSFPVPWLLWSI